MRINEKARQNVSRRDRINPRKKFRIAVIFLPFCETTQYYVIKAKNKIKLDDQIRNKQKHE